MPKMSFEKRWVLVTGASSGLGRVIAEQLAKRERANLIVVARRKDRLEELKRELGPDIQVEIITADLSRMDEVERVAELATSGRDLYAAVLNAGITYLGPHLELEWKDFEQMLATNVTGVVRLAHLLAPKLVENGLGGGLLLVSSMAGLTPVAYQSAYSGTKGFLVNWGCAFSHELEGTGIHVTIYAPGGIVTEMTGGEHFEPLRGFLMPVEQAATEALGAFKRRKQLHVPGVTNRLGLFMTRMLPRQLVTGQVAATYRRALKKTGRIL
jgi:short-subunit dehydrogenase